MHFKGNLWKYSLIFAVSIFSTNWVHIYQNNQGLKIIDTSEHPLNTFGTFFNTPKLTHKKNETHWCNTYLFKQPWDNRCRAEGNLIYSRRSRI